MTDKNARENYVTHIKRGFLEVWNQEGFWKGVKGLFKEEDKNWESQIVADIDLMMAKEKFIHLPSQEKVDCVIVGI